MKTHTTYNAIVRSLRDSQNIGRECFRKTKSKQDIVVEEGILWTHSIPSQTSRSLSGSTKGVTSGQCAIQPLFSFQSCPLSQGYAFLTEWLPFSQLAQNLTEPFLSILMAAHSPERCLSILFSSDQPLVLDSFSFLVPLNAIVQDLSSLFSSIPSSWVDISAVGPRGQTREESSIKNP